MNGDLNLENERWVIEETQNEFKFISRGKSISSVTTINRVNGKESSLIMYKNEPTLVEFQCEPVKGNKF